MKSVAALLLLALSGCRREPPLLDVPAVVRGHQDVARDDSDLVPLLLGRQPVGLCLDIPAATDMSQWEAALSFSGRSTGFAAPAARMGPAVCFDAEPPRELSTGAVDLCGLLVDRFDGSERRLPCRPILYREDPAAYDALTAELNRVLGISGERGLEPFLTELDDLASRARAAGFPLLEVRIALIEAYYLMVEGSLDRARRLLDGIPGWLDRAEASRRGAELAFQRAQLGMAAGAPSRAVWRDLEEAERRYLRIAHANRFTVTMVQADLLAQAGVPREAHERLRAALADCDRASCQPELLQHGRLQLAWLRLLDPDATRAELEEAQRSYESGLAALGEGPEPLELANHHVNAAYLQVRRGRDPGPDLRRARELLSGIQTGEARRRLLLDWALLVEALGHPGTRARAICADLSARAAPQLAAWAASCTARALRLQGDLAGADRAFEAALRHHQHADAQELGLSIPLGAGQRADDFAQAARLAVERGAPGRAWELLARLDTFAVHEGERRDCRARAGPETAARWHAIDAESARLLAELAELDGPASGARRREIEPRRRELQERLRALWREWPGCTGAPEGNDEGIDFRAFAVEDEVLLLRRLADGAVRVEKRTRMPGPLATALVPREPRSLGEVTVFALHGSLQSVPLHALPLPAGGWLADATVVALRPAAARAAVPDGGGPPLFVVDPRGDLPGGSRSAGLYRSLFPQARLLQGEEASRAAVSRGLAGAEWLHLDAHGDQDPAFPELSSLVLADGTLRLLELAALPPPRRFANLSGCRTADWPVTADSGRYGLGGLLSRLGVPWVIAARDDLDDVLAR
ncbi:MAG TPA: CHAT domain-containing protein, partial [Thermoanaerobaculia bacterium]|nr:CHAT domain-containing protein [Thermoanaerobaculia bacterium]